jgi:hypothetical protein
MAGKTGAALGFVCGGAALAGRLERRAIMHKSAAGFGESAVWVVMRLEWIIMERLGSGRGAYAEKLRIFQPQMNTDRHR